MEYSNRYWRKKRKEIRERGVEKKTQDSVKSSVVDLMFTLRVVSRTAKQIATYHVTKGFNAFYGGQYFSIL